MPAMSSFDQFMPGIFMNTLDVRIGFTDRIRRDFRHSNVFGPTGADSFLTNQDSTKISEIGRSTFQRDHVGTPGG
jgi:hypothetical protein